ncbi:MAG: phosphoribosylformylglycinamidine synthase subunit PurS [Geminicoccaceae bacterium]
MKARVEVRFKPGVLDPEAEAIRRALEPMADGLLGEVTRTRVIELELATADPEEARRLAATMADQLLANPVIEAYVVQVDNGR